MTIATDAFEVLASQHPHDVVRKTSADVETPIEKAVWLEDSVDRRFEEQTQRTTRTGTLTILASLDYAATDSFLIEAEEWTQTHLCGLDLGLRVIHLRRDDKVATGMESRNRF